MVKAFGYIERVIKSDFFFGKRPCLNKKIFIKIIKGLLKFKCLFQRIQTKDCCCQILQTLSIISFPSVLLYFYSFLLTWILHLELRVLCFTTGPGGCRANYSLISNYPTPPPSFSKELRIRIYIDRIRTQHLEKKIEIRP